MRRERLLPSLALVPQGPLPPGIENDAARFKTNREAIRGRVARGLQMVRRSGE